MKKIIDNGPFLLLILIVLVLLSACNGPSQPQPVAPAHPLQARLDSLEQRLRHSYTPGFGELMLNIQIHHAKLWFAGKNGNWQLAAYDESLIRSAIQKIRTFHPDNPNAALTTMINIPMDSVDAAITRKDAAAFHRSFTFLTTTCNNCHAVTKHPFNVITIPKSEPIGNQLYSIR
jgi:hypothetical protein